MQLIKALICQILACMLMLFFSTWLLKWNIDFRFLIFLQAAIAALLSSILLQPYWWRLIHLLFMPAVAAMLVFNLPPWLYLLFFILLCLIFWGTVKGDVPLYLSSSAVGEVLATIIKQENAGSFADIGAGIGTIVAPLAIQLPAVRITALEQAPLPWLFALWRCRNLSNIEVRLANLWHCNLADYAIVFAFLSPLVMARMGEKVRSDMQIGSLFVSSSFPVPEWLPERVIELDDKRKTRLYCYRI